MSIPDHVIEEIRDRAEILEVVGEVVRLKKRGRSWIGLCPFHTEKTPSFTVSPEKQMYYCFGCQAGGNVFTFLMEHERIEFPDAVRTLGQRVGVEVPERAEADGSGSERRHPLRQPAGGGVLPSPPARVATTRTATREYLTGRGVGRELWETFLLGWAPESWDALIGEGEAAGSGRGRAPAARASSGGARRRAGSSTASAGRVMFPIRAVGGKVVGVLGAPAGRGGAEVPEHRRHAACSPRGGCCSTSTSRGAAIRRAGAVVVVEGNFDVVALAGAGFKNVVAPLGTAFTPEQARVLKRYTSTAYLAYDGDAAGPALGVQGRRPAARRRPRACASWPCRADKDPASLVQEGGAGRVPASGWRRART